MTDEADWYPQIYDNEHLLNNLHLCHIPSTPIDTTDSFYNSVGDIVRANQAEHTVYWGNDTVRVFNSSDDLLANDDDTMPQLKERLHNDDSSSDGSDLFSDNLDEPVLHSVPAQHPRKSSLTSTRSPQLMQIQILLIVLSNSTFSTC